MSNITKSIKRIQQENFKKVVFMVIEKIQDQNLNEDEINNIIDECMLQLNEVDKTQRGKSGYNVFVSEKSAELKSNSNKKIVFKNLSKKIGDMWKKMTEEEKDIYREKAKNIPIEKKKICIGTKGNGDPCTNKTKENSNYCGQHIVKDSNDESDNKCQAKTRKNVPCTRKAIDNQDLCKIHIEKSSKLSPISSEKKCQGLTKNKDPCKRNAIVGDYCKKHSEIYGFQEEIQSNDYPKSINIGDERANLINYKNKQYYLGEEDNVCYNPITHAEIGFWDADKEIIVYN